MKKKYMIAIAAVVAFASIATAFALQVGGKDAPVTPVESIASSSVSFTIGEINSAGTISTPPTSSANSNSVSSSSNEGDKNTTTTELTSIIPKPSSTPPPPAVDGAGSETSSGGYIKATNPALTNPDKQPSYKEKPVINNGKKKTPSSSSSTKPSSSEPKPGDTKDGKTYMPGFGWVDGTGGAEGKATSGAWGGDEQIGIME